MAATKEIRKRAKRPPRTPSVRLRKSDTGGPGILRKRAGRGFFYVDADGDRVEDDEVLARIHDLVIPPAWDDVWICPYPGGHIQATGVDQKGRKQYLYHRKWRRGATTQKSTTRWASPPPCPCCASASPRGRRAPTTTPTPPPPPPRRR